MRRSLLWAALLSAVTSFAVVDVSVAAEGVKAKHASRPLRGTIYMKRYRGGYSYHYSDTLTSGRYRRYVYGLPTPFETQGAPFDNGFFFITPTGPFGGDAPAFH